jgi:hypothetical protein
MPIIFSMLLSFGPSTLVGVYGIYDVLAMWTSYCALTLVLTDACASCG